jgi:hypothetical protein
MAVAVSMRESQACKAYRELQHSVLQSVVSAAFPFQEHILGYSMDGQSNLKPVV